MNGVLLHWSGRTALGMLSELGMSSALGVLVGGAVVLVGLFFVVSRRSRVEASRARAEVALLEEKIAAVLSASPDGILLLDSEARVLFASKACWDNRPPEISDLSPGASLFKSIPEREAEGLRELLRELAAKRQPVIPPRRHKRHDGSIFWIECRGAGVFDPAGNLRVYILLFRDVTERMEAELRLEERTAKLEEAYNRITKLQNDMLSICAWTKQVYVDGKWVSVDEYLSKHLGLRLTHGISEEGIALLTKETDVPAENDHPPQKQKNRSS